MTAKPKFHFLESKDFMLTFKIPQVVLSLLVLVIAAGETQGQSSTVFNFESLPIPSDPGFYNGNPAVDSPVREFFNIDSTVDDPFGPDFGGTQFNQTLLIQNAGQTVAFGNAFETAFGSWSGFSVSRVQDSTTPGSVNQYAAFPGEGAGSSQNYLVASGFGASFTASSKIQSFDITNTTYAALAILGDDGGGGFVNGPLEDSDGFFSLTITGFDLAGIETGQQTFALADFRGSSNVFVQSWTTLDVSGLNANRLSFSYTGSDDQPNNFLNTPAYFALDNLTVTAVPEPHSASLLVGSALAVAFRRRKSVSR